MYFVFKKNEFYNLLIYGGSVFVGKITRNLWALMAIIGP